MRIAFLLLLALPVADAAPRPVLNLAGAHVDRCGVVRGTLETRAKGRDRELVVLVDGAPHPVVVPAKAESTPFAIAAGPWAPSVEVAAAWRFVDTDPVRLPRPAWDVGLWVRPPIDPAEGEVPPLEVAVTGGCDAAAFALRIEADGRPLHHGPVGPVPLPLPEGRHALTATLLDGTHEVATEVVLVDVGPPCIDVDGDGYPRCHRRDCDDDDPAIHPGATDVVGNGVDEDCDGANGQDRDRDGFEDAAVGGDDCDDRQPLVNPAAIRFPDADGDGASVFERVDFDCDGVVDVRAGPYDCDDTDPTIPRAEAPVPTGVDEDCDGVVDDGVTRPEVDDRYEPNDADPVDVPGAWYKSGLFGGRWRPSEATVRAVTRDLADVERYAVYAHDGDFDSFHVSVRVETLGDGRSYEVVVRGVHGGSVSGVLDAGGESVTIGGKAGRDDSGTYEIEVRPIAGELDWCPLELVVSTG